MLVLTPFHGQRGNQCDHCLYQLLHANREACVQVKDDLETRSAQKSPFAPLMLVCSM